MAELIIKQYHNLLNELPAWNLVRGISQTYDIAAQIPAASNIAISGTTPPNFSIDAAGVLTANLPHLYPTEIEELTISSSVGDTNLPVNIRDWFPNDAEIDLSTFFSAFRSFDGSAQELWQGLYWHPSISGGNLDTTQSVTVMSDENGYLDFDALVQELVDINQDGILYVTQITDQIDGNNLIAEDDSEPMAITIVDGVLSTFTIDAVQSPWTQRRNGHLFLRGKWNANAINSAWSGTERDKSELAATTPDMGNSWGIVSVQQKYDGANDREYRTGDNNSYPGIRDHATTRYRFNARGTRPDVLFPGLSTYEDPHCLIMSAYLTPGENIRRTIESVRLEDAAAHTVESVLVQNIANNQHEGAGRDLHFGAFFWAEGIIWELPEGTTLAERQQNEDDWQNIKTNLANNYTAVIGNTNLNYDLS